jgi:cytochrome b
MLISTNNSGGDSMMDVAMIGWVNISMHQLILLRLVIGAVGSEPLRLFHWMMKTRKSSHHLMGHYTLCLLERGPSF